MYEWLIDIEALVRVLLKALSKEDYELYNETIADLAYLVRKIQVNEPNYKDDRGIGFINFVEIAREISFFDIEGDEDLVKLKEMLNTLTTEGPRIRSLL
jgi:hypothetical protein